MTEATAEATRALLSVSVVMPVRNEAEYILRALNAVLAQDYPAELIEIIVADGMSTDGTVDIITELQSHHPNLKLIHNPGQIAPKALNLATRAASGEIIVRVDGHCEIAPDYVRNCVHHLVEEDIQGVGGSVETIGETDSARVIALAMSSRFGVGNSAFRTTRNMTMLADTIPFPAYPKTVIEQAGPYDESQVRNQDDEYNYRIREQGGRLLLAGDVHSVYYSRSSLKSLWKQYYGYGFYKARVMQKHPKQMSARQFMPSMFVAALAICLLLSPFSRGARRGFKMLVLAYVSASAAASASIASKSDWKYMTKLPQAFVAIHLTYGAGFLVGLARLLQNPDDSEGKPRI